MGLLLTGTDMQRLGDVSEALLAPLAAATPDEWQRPVAASMRALLGVAHAMLIVPDAGRVRFVCETANAVTLQALVEVTIAESASGNLRSRDPAADAWFKSRSSGGIDVYNEALVDSITGMAYKSPTFMEAMRPYGFSDFLGFTSALPGHELMMLMGGHERAGGRHFGDQELAILGALLPAFRAAHHTFATFAARRTSLIATIDALPEALLLAGSDGRPWHRNAALCRMLAADPEREFVEAVLASAASTLAGGGPTDGRRRRVAVSARDVALAVAAGAERRVATSAGAYAVRATYLPPEMLGGNGGILVSLECARPDAPITADTARRFGLTPRETEVAAALVRRLTNDEVARALGISPHTAERHTERVLAKLGVRSRHDVARRVSEAGAPGSA